VLVGRANLHVSYTKRRQSWSGTRSKQSNHASTCVVIAVHPLLRIRGTAQSTRARIYSLLPVLLHSSTYATSASVRYSSILVAIRLRDQPMERKFKRSRNRLVVFIERRVAPIQRGAILPACFAAESC